jgi:hypothetical protein
MKKIHNLKIQNPQNLSQVSRLLQKFFNTYLIFKVNLKQGNKVDGYKI